MINNTYETLTPRPYRTIPINGRPLPVSLPPANAPQQQQTQQGQGIAGANLGAIAQGAGQLIGDINEIGALAKTDTNQQVDHSFDGQTPFDQVGGFASQANPYKKNLGQALTGQFASGAKYASTGAAIGGPIGGAIGASIGSLVNVVKLFTGKKKKREFDKAQAAALQRYQTLKSQQMDYQKKQQQQIAQTNYTAERYKGMFEQ